MFFFFFQIQSYNAVSAFKVQSLRDRQRKSISLCRRKKNGDLQDGVRANRLQEIINPNANRVISSWRAKVQKHRKHLEQFILILHLYNSEITVGHNH